MALWTLDEIKDVLEVDSPLTGEVHSVSINSKEISSGDLFIPLRGEKHDAHSFVNEALEKGAIAALVDHIPDNMVFTSKILLVKDTYEALVKLAHHARQRTKAKVIGITGSFGKTTTKEMLRSMLGEQGLTSASVKSYNNHWGVPVSLCRLPHEADYGIFEVGMNHKGEISKLVEILKPQIALVTDVAEVHSQNFKNFGEIVAAKGEIFEGMGAEGTAVLNRDSDSYESLKKMAECQGIKTVITFGNHPHASVKLTSLEQTGQSQKAAIEAQGKPYTFDLQAMGGHWIQNALAALAVTQAVKGSLDKAVKALDNFQLLEGRGKVHHIVHPSGGHFTLIDESYNSNPEALRLALKTLGSVEPVNGGRRIAVIGDMYELGQSVKTVYSKVATCLEENKVDRVYTSGQDVSLLYDQLPEKKRILHAMDVHPIAEKLVQDIHPGDVILVKGSRGGGKIPRMEEVVNKLLGVS